MRPPAQGAAGQGVGVSGCRTRPGRQRPLAVSGARAARPALPPPHPCLHPSASQPCNPCHSREHPDIPSPGGLRGAFGWPSVPPNPAMQQNPQLLGQGHPGVCGGSRGRSTMHPSSQPASRPRPHSRTGVHTQPPSTSARPVPWALTPALVLTDSCPPFPGDGPSRLSRTLPTAPLLMVERVWQTPSL